MTAAHTALARRFRTEHQSIRIDIEELRATADALDAPDAMTRVRRVYETLTREVWPRESAEETELYPSLNRLLGGVDPTAPMSRAHAEIAYQIARSRLIDEIGTGMPDDTAIADLRSLLYGLHAILKLHTVQEDETYLSLGDDAGVLLQGDLRHAHPSR
jgi:Hemerythrin HHE cation binding domain